MVSNGIRWAKHTLTPKWGELAGVWGWPRKWESKPVVLNQGLYCLPGDIQQHLEKFSVVTTGDILLVSSGQRPGVPAKHPVMTDLHSKE